MSHIKLFSRKFCRAATTPPFNKISAKQSQNTEFSIVKRLAIYRKDAVGSINRRCPDLASARAFASKTKGKKKKKGEEAAEKIVESKRGEEAVEKIAEEAPEKIPYPGIFERFRNSATMLVSNILKSVSGGTVGRSIPLRSVQAAQSVSVPSPPPVGIIPGLLSNRATPAAPQEQDPISAEELDAVFPVEAKKTQERTVQVVGQASRNANREKHRLRSLKDHEEIVEEIWKNCKNLSMTDWTYKNGVYTSLWDPKLEMRTRPSFGWVEVPRDNNRYYWNVVTNETSWKRPELERLRYRPPQDKSQSNSDDKGRDTKSSSGKI